jgi:hypothetical protein
LLVKSYIVRERYFKSALSRNLILAVITISIVAALTLTTIFTGGILSAHDHLALAQSVNDPQQQEENKETATSQDDHDDDEQISLSRDEKEGKDDNDADIASSIISGQKVCRKGDVLADNHDPGKYELLSRCEEVSGTIEKDEGRQHDGDLKYILDVGDEYKYLLNDENDEKANGMLVIEINPNDQDASMIVIPEEGDRIRVVGAWVTDDPDGYPGWNEIHPVWQIDVLE